MRIQGLYEVVVRRAISIELFDDLDVRSEQGCLTAATERRTHKNDTLDYAFGAPDEKITVLWKVGIFSVLEEHLGESLEF